MTPATRTLLAEAMMKAASEGTSPQITLTEATVENLVASARLPDTDLGPHPADDDSHDPMGQAACAARLRAARHRRFSSAARAAQALAVNPITLRAHENGQNGFSVRDASRYSKAYGVTLLWLLTGESDQAAAV